MTTRPLPSGIGGTRRSQVHETASATVTATMNAAVAAKMSYMLLATKNTPSGPISIASRMIAFMSPT